MLLPANTIKGVCETCHDGTGGGGVYRTITARGLTPGATHDIDSTSLVPGGNAATGGSVVTSFTGEGDFLGCDDCHTPHDANSVAAFYGDRRRSNRSYPLPRNEIADSNKLLKRMPTSGTTETADYGSDWCLACHKGRRSGGAVHNHPAESTQTAPGAYVYRNLPVVTADTPTATTVMGQLGGRTTIRGSGNRGYLMPYPRTAQQTGHYPICQQCHEDSRDVGDLDVAGLADAEPSVVTTLDGSALTDNPRFQNFPHESVNRSFLVELDDDLCLNCHPVSVLP